MTGAAATTATQGGIEHMKKKPESLQNPAPSLQISQCG